MTAAAKAPAGSGDQLGLEVKSGVPAVRGEVTAAIEHAPAATPVSIEQLMQLALEKGAGVDALERLVSLKERMEDRKAGLDFANAMAAFQSECPRIKKSSTAKITTGGGGAYSYTYAELDEIAATVNPILFKHGLSYSWDSAIDKNILTCICIIRHVHGHSTRTTFSLPTDSASAMSAQQKVAAALTFAKRQSLVAALGLVTTDEDTDAVTREIDPTPVNAAQLKELEALIGDADLDIVRFLKFLGIEHLKDLPRSRLDEAKAAIVQRKRRKEAK